MPTLEVLIDGTDVTQACIEGSYTRRLSRTSQAQVTIPYDLAIGDTGSLLKIAVDGELRFHGRVLMTEVQMGEDSGNVIYSASDPLELWQWRPVRSDFDGDLAKPPILESWVTAPMIVLAMIRASTEGGIGVDPDDIEGTLHLEIGYFALGGASMLGAPTDYPMTMAELANLLVSTGELDIVLTPIDSGDNWARIDCYNGDYGTDRSGEVFFQYGLGNYSIREFRWTKDMTNMVNKLWYLIGTKLDDRHWPYGIKGENIGAWPYDLIAQVAETIEHREISQVLYDQRMEIKIFDSQLDLGAFGDPHAGIRLYQQLWLEEQWFRSDVLQMIHFTPTRGTGIDSFDIGDLIWVECTPAVRGGFAGVQRVYEYTVSWDTDSVLTLAELQTSPLEGSF